MALAILFEYIRCCIVSTHLMFCGAIVGGLSLGDGLHGRVHRAVIGGRTQRTAIHQPMLVPFPP